MNKELINKKIQDVLWRLGFIQQLVDDEEISISKFTRARQRLIAELHTLRFVLGKGDLDSDNWIKEFKDETK